MRALPQMGERLVQSSDIQRQGSTPSLTSKPCNLRARFRVSTYSKGKTSADRAHPALSSGLFSGIYLIYSRNRAARRRRCSDPTCSDAFGRPGTFERSNDFSVFVMHWLEPLGDSVCISFLLILSSPTIRSCELESSPPARCVIASSTSKPR